jgi:hypothetical protein
MLRDMAVVPVAALQPLVELEKRAGDVLRTGWDGSRAPVLISLAIQFASWKKLRREHDMPSKAIVDFWSGLVDCTDV